MGSGSIEGAETNEIFGYRIVEMDHMPDIAANAFPVAFGNFREGYLAVERTSLRITIDDNITTPGTVKFYVRKRVGGIVRQDQAIKVIKAAAS
jgi:HK97 family phage major capsid protein